MRTTIQYLPYTNSYSQKIVALFSPLLHLLLRRKPRSLGELVITHDAALALRNAGKTAEPLLPRHLVADWGIMDESDREANDYALKNGGRLLSCYALSTGAQIWIIAEADRTVTTMLTPQEY